MSPEPEEKMKKLFNISYNIAKCERPFSDFADLCKRHAKNGLLRNAYIHTDRRFVIYACSVELGWVPLQSPWKSKQYYDMVKAQTCWKGRINEH